MNSIEFKKIWAVASDTETYPDLSDETLDHMYGYGMKDFKPVVTTVKQVAALMRYQGLGMNGTWDMEEVNDIRELGRKNFSILGSEKVIFIKE